MCSKSCSVFWYSAVSSGISAVSCRGTSSFSSQSEAAENPRRKPGVVLSAPPPPPPLCTSGRAMIWDSVTRFCFFKHFFQQPRDSMSLMFTESNCTSVSGAASYMASAATSPFRMEASLKQSPGCNVFLYSGTETLQEPDMTTNRSLLTSPYFMISAWASNCRTTHILATAVRSASSKAARLLTPASICSISPKAGTTILTEDLLGLAQRLQGCESGASPLGDLDESRSL
mmetsp:Transcript_135263/g.432398  ORF Transcript_135263/g.432398 Transcript_135263/m.432398 type:complete len:230 (+) Transcript_135263:804-1493(+)